MNRCWKHLALAMMVLLGGAVAGSPAPAQANPTMSVVVQGASATTVATAVRAAGGSVRATLDIIGGVSADIPVAAAALLRSQGHLVVADRPAGVAATGFGPAAGDVQLVALNPGPRWDRNAGAGVGVALIDTGVADVPDLAGRLVRGPDLSGEGDGRDRHGHGTFMAGLIAGDGSAGANEPVLHTGVAPGAHVVSVKVAGRDGVTTLSRLLEAIGWVVDHAREQNVRVLNLAFGVDSRLPWVADPLSMAVERAWASGITVVAAAGNTGAGPLPAPGRDPWVLTVGASDPRGTAAPDDDSVPSWSGWDAKGPFTKPDVVAPGVSAISLRAPASLIDDQHPLARVGKAYFKGSGTSMATALTAGAAAVLLADHPAAVPDDVKGALANSARPIAGSTAGAVDLAAAGAAPSERTWWQEHPLAGDRAGRPERLPWSEDGKWSTSRWYTSRWYTSRWYTSRWYTSRWYTSRWYAEPWAADGWTTSQWFGDWSGPAAPDKGTA